MSYSTVAEADTYFTNRLNTEVWDESTYGEKQIALAEAYVLINNLNYAGLKDNENQEGEFPRDGVTPSVLLQAEAEIALKLLEGWDADLEYSRLFKTHAKIGIVGNSYGKSAESHIVHGIPSVKAWRLLLPLLASHNTVRLNRVS